MIREAKVSEAPDLTELAVRSKAHWGYSDEFMAACRDELAVTADKISDERLSYRVLERGGRIVGFYCLEHPAGDYVELEALFVAPERLGKGIGRALFADAASLAGQLGGRSLVIQSDPHAADFYRGLGAQQVGTRASGSLPDRELPLFEMPLSS